MRNSESAMNRRDFLKTSAAAAGASIAASGWTSFPRQEEPIFKISLAQWSLNRRLFAGDLDNLDFARVTKEHGIDAVEYVNQFFFDKAEDRAYLSEMKDRAASEGVTNVLIMCDREGRLGDPNDAERKIAVENHYKWVEAAQFLGCHSIRVNGYSEGTFEEQRRLVADGLHQLCEFADDYDVNVVIENHGGYSSHAGWLAGVIRMADHPRAGTLPDFGNFRIDGENSYDTYQGVAVLMPFATGVSVKPTAWDHNGNQSELDYDRVMRIVLDAGYRGHCGIEHGPDGSEWEGIETVHRALLATREQLTPEYS